MQKELIKIVVVGHVDHGKSTVIGRLLADTKTLPEGKLENIQKHCEKNAKPFEYAYLLDALKDEQSQGITIDTARCFFETENEFSIYVYYRPLGSNYDELIGYLSINSRSQ